MRLRPADKVIALLLLGTVAFGSILIAAYSRSALLIVVLALSGASLLAWSVLGVWTHTVMRKRGEVPVSREIVVLVCSFSDIILLKFDSTWGDLMLPWANLCSGETLYGIVRSLVPEIGPRYWQGGAVWAEVVSEFRWYDCKVHCVEVGICYDALARLKAAGRYTWLQREELLCGRPRVAPVAWAAIKAYADSLKARARRTQSETRLPLPRPPAGLRMTADLLSLSGRP